MKNQKRIIVHGFNVGIINFLRAKFRVFWIADDPLADIQYLKLRDNFSLNSRVDLLELDRILRKLSMKADVIYECYSRHHYANSIDGSGLSVQDYSNLLLSHVSIFLNIFTDFNPELVISSNMPHEGYDNVLFELARCKNVKTLKFFQVPFGPRHWVLSDSITNAFGKVKKVQLDDEELDLTYVNNYIDQLKGGGKLHYMLDTSASYVPKYNNAYFFNVFRDYFCRQQKPMKFLYKFYFIFRRLTNDFKNYYINRLYKINIKSFSIEGDRLMRSGAGYGYFALHLQPELTTSALGNGIYHNQLAALKIFADFCRVNNLTCIVKDNPKQNFSHRSKNFFKALSSLDNVRMVNNDEDSLALVRSASVVGTITGTVGVEALLHGVPVVCFGDAWYGSLEGVVRPHQLNESIFDMHVDPMKTKIGIAALYGAAVKGVSDFDYLSVFDVDADNNDVELLESLLRALN
jgi:hypothetical protein